MKVAKVLSYDPSIEEQIELLKKKVLIKHPDFSNKTTGIIVSICLKKGYWILLNEVFEKKDGKFSKRKYFKEKELRLIE